MPAYYGDEPEHIVLLRDTLTVFQVQAYLEAFNFTNIGRSAALVIVLWAITYALSTVFIKNWLKLRAKARGAT